MEGGEEVTEATGDGGECGVKQRGGKIEDGDRERETAKEIITNCKAFNFPLI